MSVLLWCSAPLGPVGTGPSPVGISAVSNWGARYHTVPVYFYFWCALILQLSERRSSHIITFGLGGVSACLCPLAARWSSRVSVEPGLSLSPVWNFLRTCFSARDGLADKNKPRWPMEVMRVPAAARRPPADVLGTCSPLRFVSVCCLATSVPPVSGLDASVWRRARGSSCLPSLKRRRVDLHESCQRFSPQQKLQRSRGQTGSDVSTLRLCFYVCEELCYKLLQADNQHS